MLSVHLRIHLACAPPSLRSLTVSPTMSIDIFRAALDGASIAESKFFIVEPSL
jgi:hypothetical protein